MLNGICAAGIDNAPAFNTGSTNCFSFASSVACPLSLARIATSKARGLRPSIFTASSVTVPLPDNEPVSAAALRPWLCSVICIDARPAGMARFR